jgi:phenylacetate-CoA ligase
MKKLYYKLPIFAQHIACSIEGARLKKRRFTKEFINKQRDINNRYSYDHDEMMQIRDNRLSSFINFASRYVPYYKDIFQREKIHPDDIQSINDLKILPIITKGDVKNNWNLFLPENINEINYHISRTSGTTGSGLKVAITRDASQEVWAVILRFRKWHGLQSDVWSAHFGGREIVAKQQDYPPYWRYNIPGKQIIFSGYHMNERSLEDYVKEIIKRKIEWIHGYPSLIALLANYIVDHNIKIENIVKWVTTGSENLLPHQRNIIRIAFNVTPRQQYGLTELVAHFSECEYGRFHVDEDFSAVEFIRNDEDNSYKIIGTNFSNYAMPLIRYETNDLAIIAKSCECGRPGRVVDKIDGRHEDYIVLKDGTRHGRIAGIFKFMENIKEAQIYQKEPGKVIIKIVPSSNYSKKDDDMLKENLKQRYHGKLDITFEHKDKIERTKSGKLRFVVSEISNGKI